MVKEAELHGRKIAQVERAEQRRNVGLEKTVADDEQPEREVQQRRERHREVAHRHDEAADQDRLAGTEPAVGDIAADYGREINQAGVSPIQRERVGALVVERVDQVQHQQRAHAVVAEALPHLGEEERREAPRMPKERAIAS